MLRADGHRILITGAKGFVGRWLEAELRGRDGVAVFGIDMEGSVDVRDDLAVDRAIRETAPTGIVHLAAMAAPVDANQSPSDAWDVNLIGTFNVADACRRLCPEARFVYVSSAEAYGQSFNDYPGPVPESAPLLPLSTYGATKAAAEVLVGQLARRGLNATIFRPFNHTGAGQGPHFVAPAFARQIALIERNAMAPLLRVGSLEARRDFLDVRDVVRAYSGVVRGDVTISPGTAINLSTGSPVAIRDLLDGLLSLTSCKVEVVEDPALVRSSELPIASGDPARARELLGWEPLHRLEDTLAGLLAWWRDDVNVRAG